MKKIEFKFGQKKDQKLNDSIPQIKQKQPPRKLSELDPSKSQLDPNPPFQSKRLQRGSKTNKLLNITKQTLDTTFASSGLHPQPLDQTLNFSNFSILENSPSSHDYHVDFPRINHLEAEANDAF